MTQPIKKGKKEMFVPVYVKWSDALSWDGWRTPNEAFNWAEEREWDYNMDCGWLIKKTDKYVLLTVSYSPRSGQYDYIKKIPRKMIKKIVYLK